MLLPFISVGLWRLLARVGLEMRATDKMLVGFILTAASMGVMAVAGVRAEQGIKVSIWWQVGTYFLDDRGRAAGFLPSGLELAFTAAPRSMKGFITACFLLMVFFGNLLDTVVTRYYGELGPARYFGVLTGLMVVVTIAFVFLAQRFNRGTIGAEAAKQAALAAFGGNEPPSEAIKEADAGRFRSGRPE